MFLRNRKRVKKELSCLVTHWQNHLKLAKINKSHLLLLLKSSAKSGNKDKKSVKTGLVEKRVLRKSQRLSENSEK